MWKSVLMKIRSKLEGLSTLPPKSVIPRMQTRSGGSWDGSITLWDVETATRIARFPAHVGAVVLLEFTPMVRL
jgi:WD40 repeat protein